MGYVKKAAPYARAVLRGMLFIGFSVQIVLGVCWTCCNFGGIQSFGEPDSALYAAVLGLLGGTAPAMYLLQLAAAFLAGYLFLQRLQPVGRGLAVWRGLALLTFPFALQCHLALQPYSLMGSCFLLLLLALLELCRKRAALPLLAALACGAMFLGLGGALDSDRQESPAYSPEGAMASRFAWPTLWNDYDHYEEELWTIVQPCAWEASLSPDNMGPLLERLEDQVGTEAARAYYLQMAKVAWDRHAPGILRQICWDMLGYAAIPVIFPLQMEGRAYDSYSARNYEVMREGAPILTRSYVDYGCWWFAWMLVISAFLLLIRPLEENGGGIRDARRRWGRRVAGGICILACGILVVALTMRGAGRMDYRETIAVDIVWLTGPLLLLGRERPVAAGRKGK